MITPQGNLLPILQRISFIGLVVIVFISLTLFAMSFDTTLPKLKQQENESLAKLTLMHGKSVKILLVKNRLATIGTVLKQRTSYEALLAQISKLIPASTSVDAMDIGNGTIAFTISSSSLSDLSDLLDTMTDMANNKQTFTSLHVDDLNLSGQKYTVIIKAGLI